ncbi:hypothetical protein VFPPC_15320 [Pochonia chlamydosporia 170]|uniref:Uncharacterized protein n=1 Tax=Pochonia chlamydosporia 170 TaxID=1380566 RepID=A0A179G7Q5_METCM|nr:hypothetical protein VFPPC_15320 [Pochonia chlamydosporia 170]OAQ73540.1 hypothetical protein VFPPC_15320 [Pochonia chlamydosporia 170]
MTPGTIQQIPKRNQQKQAHRSNLSQTQDAPIQTLGQACNQNLSGQHYQPRSSTSRTIKASRCLD